MSGINMVRLDGLIGTAFAGPWWGREDEGEFAGYVFTVKADGEDVPVLCVDSRPEVLDRLVDRVHVSQYADVRGYIRSLIVGSLRRVEVVANTVNLYGDMQSRGYRRFNLDGRAQGGTRAGGVAREGGMDAHEGDTMSTITYVVQGYYRPYGWEDLTAEETIEEARERMREYRENEGGSYRIRRRIERSER